ncbi:hypothetical protein AAGW05_11190 [Arthrobacter sp. LAPM80]|uniref:hypothetical protein n=1 Tax=Arthrobacter sp. LAPM80 TaxID=3141788 RepID=UPI00398B0854
MVDQGADAAQQELARLRIALMSGWDVPWVLRPPLAGLYWWARCFAKYAAVGDPHPAADWAPPVL